MSAVESLIIDNLDLWTSAIKSKSSAGRGSNKKIELYGIKKLRDLILELAVRGLLVPQEPCDEPASYLLKKIAAEKNKRIKAGELKRQKPLPAIGDEEKPFALPKGWAWTCLYQISEIAPRNNLPDNLEVSFVPMPMISTSYKGEHDHEAKIWADIKKGYTHFADGDIGLAKITPCFENSKAVVFKDLKNGFGAGTTELHIARPIANTIEPLFVLLYLKSPMFLEKGKTKMTGSAGQKRVPTDYFSYNPLPLPPLDEQRRIVSKVDELMQLCDQLEQQAESSINAHQVLVEQLLAVITKPEATESATALELLFANFDSLFTTAHSIEQLKQSILQLAVMGKLVPQDPIDEPASELLKKIAAEKTQLIKAGKIKKSKPLPPIREEEKPFTLPKGWEWSRLGNLFEVTSSKRIHAKDYSFHGIPFFRSKEIGDLYRNQEIRTEIFISEELFNSLRNQSGFPVKGDLLLTAVGTIGNQWLCDGRDFYYKDGNIAKIGFNENFSMKYLSKFIDSKVFSSQVIDTVSGTAYSALTIVKLNNIVIAVPPIANQCLISQEVDRLIAICDQLSTNLASAENAQLLLADALAEQTLTV